MVRERPYAGSLSLGKLETALESHEPLFGAVTKLEGVAGSTVATYSGAGYPGAPSLALLPSIGGAAPPAPPGAKHLFDGEAVVLGATMAVSVFRTT